MVVDFIQNTTVDNVNYLISGFNLNLQSESEIDESSFKNDIQLFPELD